MYSQESLQVSSVVTSLNKTHLHNLNRNNPEYVAGSNLYVDIPFGKEVPFVKVSNSLSKAIEGLTSNVRRVYLYLIVLLNFGHRTTDSTCEQIAKEVELHPKTVAMIVKVLITMGLINKVRQRTANYRTRNTYALPLQFTVPQEANLSGEEPHFLIAREEFLSLHKERGNYAKFKLWLIRKAWLARLNVNKGFEVSSAQAARELNVSGREFRRLKKLAISEELISQRHAITVKQRHPSDSRLVSKHYIVVLNNLNKLKQVGHRDSFSAEQVGHRDSFSVEQVGHRDSPLNTNLLLYEITINTKTTESYSNFLTNKKKKEEFNQKKLADKKIREQYKEDKKQREVKEQQELSVKIKIEHQPVLDAKESVKTKKSKDELEAQEKRLAKYTDSQRYYLLELSKKSETPNKCLSQKTLERLAKYLEPHELGSAIKYVNELSDIRSYDAVLVSYVSDKYVRKLSFDEIQTKYHEKYNDSKTSLDSNSGAFNGSSNQSYHPVEKSSQVEPQGPAIDKGFANGATMYVKTINPSIQPIDKIKMYESNETLVEVDTKTDDEKARGLAYLDAINAMLGKRRHAK